MTFLFTDLDGSAQVGGEPGHDIATAVQRHYELLDEAITGAGGVRPVEQGEGESVIGTFTRPADAMLAAAQYHADLGRTILFGLAARLAAELPMVPVRMAIHTSEAQLRGAGRYVGGPSPRVSDFGRSAMAARSSSRRAQWRTVVSACPKDRR